MQPLLLLSLATAAAAAVIAPPVYTGKATVPDVQTSSSWNRKDAVVKKIRYGPFRLPASTMNKNGEMVAATVKQVVPLATKPCDECMIMMMSARTEFADGSEAADPGTYLHHAAMLASGPLVKDGNCAKPGADLFFSSGNEKSPIIYTTPDGAMNAGYYMGPYDILVAQTELLNQEPVDKDIWVAYSFEIVDGKPSSDWRHTRVAWISADMAACDAPVVGAGLTEEAGQIPPPNNKAFNLTSIDWKSPYEGEILACGGHMHNGGVATEIYHQGALICDSKATYATGTAMSMADKRSNLRRDGGSDQYLSAMSGCVMPGKVEKGDKIKMTAIYDFEAHPGMKNPDGSLAPIMALATCFIAAKQ